MLRPCLTVLALLLLAGCPGGGNLPDSRTPAERRAVLANPPAASRDFTYPPEGRTRYRKAIDEFYRHQPWQEPSEQKRALIRKHIEWAERGYDQAIAGSRIRIFMPNAKADQEFLGIGLGAPGAAPAAPADQPRSLDFGAIHYHLHATPYDYRNHEAYVAFAHRRIGGSVLGEAFAQEEMALLETNFLPFVAAMRDRAAATASFAPDIPLDQLDRRPVVVGLRRFLQVAHPQEIYGLRLARLAPFDPDRYLRPLPEPMDIYLAAMAAKPFNSPRAQGVYVQADITGMTLLAARAFYDTLMAQYRDQQPLAIHTGNWGTGIYRNSRRTIWAIQRVAIEAAYRLFSQTTGQALPLEYHYHAFDPEGVRAANEALEVYATQIGGARTVAASTRRIFSRTQRDVKWQVQTSAVPAIQ